MVTEEDTAPTPTDDEVTEAAFWIAHALHVWVVEAEAGERDHREALNRLGDLTPPNQPDPAENIFLRLADIAQAADPAGRSRWRRFALNSSAGAGKSVLARLVVRAMRADGATVVAFSLTERSWRTLADVEAELHARMETALSAAATTNGRLLLIGGAEQMLADGGALLRVVPSAPDAPGGTWRSPGGMRQPPRSRRS